MQWGVGLAMKRSRVRLPIEVRPRNNSGQILHIVVTLSPGTSQQAMKFCHWEGNRRFGTALKACITDFRGLLNQALCLQKADEHPTYAPQGRSASIPIYSDGATEP